MLALEWLSQARGVIDRIEATQMENIRRAAAIDGGVDRGRPMGPHLRLRARDDPCRGDVPAALAASSASTRSSSCP